MLKYLIDLQIVHYVIILIIISNRPKDSELYDYIIIVFNRYHNIIWFVL